VAVLSAVEATLWSVTKISSGSSVVSASEATVSSVTSVSESSSVAASAVEVSLAVAS